MDKTMTGSMMAAFLTFAFVSSITPGPNNIMLLASGANFGFRRTVPHMLGVILGFGLMVLLVGLGIAAVLARTPMLFTIARIAGIAYLIYLAWRIASTDGIGTGLANAKPMSFLQATAFQWANPKAWSMAISAVTAYAPQDNVTRAVVLFAAIFVAIGVPSASLWTSMGVGVKRGLSNPRALRIFNMTMAALLLLSLYPMAKAELPAARAHHAHMALWPTYRPLQ
jgi:threonine/homoserine/homoserine lactone efflux protein